jgi:hypothetical protein
VIYLRQVCSQQVLADLLEVTQAAIGPAIKETRRLLEEHRHAIAPTILRLTPARRMSWTTPAPARSPPTLPGQAGTSSCPTQP